MKKLRVYGLVLFVLGLIFSLSSVRITGAVIGSSGKFAFSFIGIVFIMVGIVLMMSRDRNRRSIDEEVKEIVEDIHNKIREQKGEYKANPRFIKGLEEIERGVDEDKDNYFNISGPENNQGSSLKRAILKRLQRRRASLDRREQFFFSLPRHVSRDPKTHETTILDLPDKGLYEYEPLGGRGSRKVILDMVHYTPNSSYNQIKDDFERSKKEDILFGDANGWAYFISEPLPQRLNMKTVRRVLGTGNQTYVGKTSSRNPEYEIRFRIRVPKERVLEKEEVYSLPNGENITVRKYAIAGGISRKDIIGEPEGKRYVDKSLPEHHSNKGKEKWSRVA